MISTTRNRVHQETVTHEDVQRALKYFLRNGGEIDSLPSQVAPRSIRVVRSRMIQRSA